MRNFTAILTVLALALAFSSAPAAMYNNNMELNVGIGGALNVSDGDRADLFPSGFAVHGDLNYRINPRFALVPVSLAIQIYNYDPVVNGVIEDIAERLPVDTDVTPPSTLDIDGSAWSIAYLPGFYFNTNSDHRVNLFGQVGAGISFYDETFEALEDEVSYDETSFAARISAGVSYMLSERADLNLRSGYMYVNTDQARDKFVEFNAGLKYMF